MISVDKLFSKSQTTVNMIEDAELETFPAMGTGKDSGSTDEAARLIEQLRDHLETQTHQQVERTKNMRRNVVIRIDRRDRRPRAQERGTTMQYYKDSISKLTQCCTPIPALNVASYETPSTQSTSMSLDAADSNSFLLSYDDSYRVTEFATLSIDSATDTTAMHNKHKAFLRLKADILTDGSTDGGFGSTTDGASTDGDCTDRDFTDHEGYHDESFSVASSHSPPGASGRERALLDARDDEEGDGDDEMEDESYLLVETETRDTFEETTIECQGTKSQQIFSVKSEHSTDSDVFEGDDVSAVANVNVMSTKESSPALSASVMVEDCASAQYPVSATSPSRPCGPSSTTPDNHHNQAEEALGGASRLELIQEGTTTCPMIDKYIDSPDPQMHNEDAQESKESEGGLEDESARRKLNALADIGKALEEASLNVSLRRLETSSSKKGSIAKVPGDIPDSPLVKGELAIVSSGSLLSRDSVLTTGSDMIVSIESLYKIPFIHGSFAAAAPFVMIDLKWKRILRKLMPDAHARAVAQMRKTDSIESLRVTQMMKWAENNPVVAAYGILSNQYDNVAIGIPEMNAMPTPMASNKDRSTDQFKKTPVPSRPVTKQTIPPLEWNVFLDPLIASQVDAAITNERNARTGEEKCEAERVLRRHMSRLVKRMILSHGSTSQLISEAFGFHRACTFAAIVQEVEYPVTSKQRSKVQIKKYDTRSKASKRLAERVSKSVGAGMFATKWLATLAAALHLGGKLQEKSAVVDKNNGVKGKLTVVPKRNAEDEIVDDLLADSSDEMIQNLNPACSVLLCLGFHDPNSTGTDANKNSLSESAKYISGMLGGPLRLVLNLRSRHVPAQVWARLVDYMRDNDILVESVASFDGDELRSIGSLVAAPVKQYRFFHSAGDLQKACHAGDIREGDSVFFNAASLIATDQDPMNALLCGLDEYNDEIVFSEYAHPKSAIAAHRRTCKASIEDYKKRFQLNIGCYIQEFTVSPHTVDCLVAFFNLHSATYNLGLAYGGINGKVVSGGLDGDGFGRQRFMGTQWDTDAKPLYNMQPLAPWHDQRIQKSLLAGSWGPLGTINDGGPGTKSKFKW